MLLIFTKTQFKTKGHSKNDVTKQQNITKKLNAAFPISTQHVSEEQVKTSLQLVENNVSNISLC